ncbi:glycoside hydrolase family 2 TIM barrel-domain containing protein [Chitinophaga parva]|uniref:glycoside hydrolase family 2 TIM barrel-domain containing protein n=1 Tax=Chitinophaga parva TaxID=2169414 RepID=UPI0014033F23|nr:glycoside hydrolase family 2 TIM barrel-domain containing protein [Chitinophaga parva]
MNILRHKRPERATRTFALLLPLLAMLTAAQAQTNSRQVINFNNDWELFRIDSAQQLKRAVNTRNGNSFVSQFNQETVTSKRLPADSIRAQETREALYGFSVEYPAIAQAGWEPISLPHPARYEQELNPNVNGFTGICYYRKTFHLPPGSADKHNYIRFEGAMHTATAWINGRFITQHAGGYLPFNVPLDGNVHDGANEIIVRVDNRDNVNVPPGKPLARMGFLYWSGIYRGAWLVTTDKIFITDPTDANTVAGGGVFVRPQHISARSAEVVIRTQLKNLAAQSSPVILKQTLINSATKARLTSVVKMTIAGGATTDTTQSITVPHPALWSPDAPHLYTVVTEVWQNKRLVDEMRQQVGIRKLSYTRAGGFELNDRPLRIVGTNRHQDFPFVGNALTAAMQQRDLKRIKEAGFNFVRLSHYPQDPSVYTFCDSIGLMLGDPIPGWQFFNANEVFSQRVFSDIRQMIRRDRNHPSVVMWEVSLNETYPADSFRIASSRVAHEEYPGDNFFTAGDTYAAKHTAWDVPYNSWEDPFGRPQDVQPEQPGFVREYGDYEFGGDRSTTRVTRADGEQALLQSAWNFQWEHNLLSGPQYYPWTIGDATWAFYDGFEATHNTTSNWGSVDIYRIPKFSYYFFRSQLPALQPVFGAANKPMVYIANWWTPADQPGKVVVYANCDAVALYRNDTLIRQQQPDHGPDTEYGDFDKGGHPFDGGNARHLAHPPFTFTDIRWQPGTLKAVGYIKGKPVAEQVVHSPGEATRVGLQDDTEGIPLQADGADAVFVHARVMDANGTVICTDNATQVAFSVRGNGRMISPAVVTVRGGIASVLVQAERGGGIITVTASSKGLGNADLRINTVKQ